MKVCKKLICILIISVITFSLMSCSSSENDTNILFIPVDYLKAPSGYTTQDWHKVYDAEGNLNEDEYMFADFESRYEFTSIVMRSSVFGKISLSSDYVQSGNTSMKIEVSGNGYIYKDHLELPALIFCLWDKSQVGDSPILKDYGQTDFLNEYSAIEFFAYNSMEIPGAMHIGCNGNYIHTKHKVILPPQEWTRVRVEYSDMGIPEDLEGEKSFKKLII